MSGRKKFMIVAFILMQTLLLTQVDFSLAVMPASINATDMAHAHNSFACLLFLQCQSISQTACIYMILSLVPHLPADSLLMERVNRGLSMKENGQLFATLINHISKALLRCNGRVLVDNIPNVRYIWAYTIEAVAPPSDIRPILAGHRYPNC